MSKRFKFRWVYKAISWKIISAALGALVVLGLTGQYAMSWGYLMIYVPISLFLFVGHEYVWQQIKIRSRCPECDGAGTIIVGYAANAEPKLCPRCDGTGGR